MLRPNPARHPLDCQHWRRSDRYADLTEEGVVDVAKPSPIVCVLLLDEILALFLLPCLSRNEHLALFVLPCLSFQGLLIHVALHHSHFQEIEGAESLDGSWLGQGNDF